MGSCRTVQGVDDTRSSLSRPGRGDMGPGPVSNSQNFGKRKGMT